MTTDRTEHLIQLSIDGAATSDELSELRAALDDSPEARAIDDDLRHVAASISSEPEIDPPSSLRDSIMGAIASSAAPSAAAERNRFQSRTSGYLRLAAALAAGMILGIVGGPLLTDPGEIDDSMIKGTMSSPVRQQDAPSTFPIDSDAVTGEVRLARVERNVVLDVDFVASEPTTLDLTFDAASTRLRSFSQKSGPPVAISAASGVISIEPIANGQLSFSFEADPASGGVTVRMLQGDTPVFEARVSQPPG